MRQDLASSSPAITLDLRPLLSSERHAAVFAALERLRDGQSMELVNDHDPLLLHLQLESRQPGDFDWDYLDRGPLSWRVSIRKLAGRDGAGCCGGCGGSGH